MANERDVETAERIRGLEVTQESHEEELKMHAEHLRTLDRAMISLTSEVKGVKRALYVMTALLGASSPHADKIMALLSKVIP